MAKKNPYQDYIDELSRIKKGHPDYDKAQEGIARLVKAEEKQMEFDRTMEEIRRDLAKFPANNNILFGVKGNYKIG